MKKRLLKIVKNPHFLPLLIITFLGILSSLSLFKDNRVLVGLDTWTPLDIELRMKEWPYLWGYYSSIVGADFSSRIVFLPQMLSYYILHKVGFTLLTSQKIVFTQIFLVAGWSMYFLGTTLWKKSLPAFMASLIFMFNPVFAGFWQQFLPDAIYSFVGFPFVLAVFLRCLNSSQVLKSASLFGLSTLIILPYNPPMYAMEIGIILLFLVFNFLFSDRKKDILKFSVFSLVFFLLINLWWLVPMASWIPSFASYNEQEMTFFDRLIVQGGRAGLPNAIRLMGSSYWGYSMWEEKPSNILGFLYEKNPVLLFLSFIYPLFAFIALILYKKDKKVLFLSSLSLFFLFLTKGVNEPLGSVYVFLYNNLPGFFVFRTPSDKFWLAILVFYSLLIGLSVSGIFHYLKRISRLLASLILVVIVSIFLIFQWPFFTGDVIPNGKSAVPSVAVNFPKSYGQLASFLKEQKDSFRIMSLPGANRPTRWLVYNWGFLGVYPLLSEIFGKPVIEKQPQDVSDLMRVTAYYQLGNYSDISGIINEKQAMNDSVYKLLGLMNTKYILVNRDVDWQHVHYGTEKPADIEEKLSKQKNIKFEKQFDNLRLYSLNEDAILPEIYPSPIGRETYFWGEPERMGNLFSFPDFTFEDGLFVQVPSTVWSSNIFVSSEYQFYKPNFRRNYFETPYFPFVRYVPGDLGYTVVRFKDSLKEGKAPNLILDTELALYNKRLAEIKKLVEISRYDEINKLIDQYEIKINFLMNFFMETLAQRETSFMYAQRIERELTYQENFFILQMKILTQNDQPVDRLKDVLSKYPGWYSTLEKYFDPWWFDKSSAAGQAAYSFNIPKKGEYDVYFNTGDLKSLALNENGRFQLDANIKSKSGFSKQLSNSFDKLFPHQWVSLSKVRLSPGNYVLTLDSKETENIVQSETFNVIGEGKLTLKTDTEEKNKIYELEASARKPVVYYITFPYFDTTDNFKISFSYRNVSGKPLRFSAFKSKLTDFSKEMLWEDFEVRLTSLGKKKEYFKDGIHYYNKCSICFLYHEERLLDKEPQWQKFEINMGSGEGANILGIVFFLEEDDHYDLVSLNQIKDLRVEKVFNNPIVLRMVNRVEKPQNLPELKYKRINPTRYEIQVKAREPFNLIFSQTYNAFWKIHFLGKKEIQGEVVASYPRLKTQEIASESIFFQPSFIFKPQGKELSNRKHYRINSFANGWSVDKTGEFTIVLEYSLQRYFYVLLGLSLISVFVILSLLFLNILKGKKGLG